MFSLSFIACGRVQLGRASLPRKQGTALAVTCSEQEALLPETAPGRKD